MSKNSDDKSKPAIVNESQLDQLVNFAKKIPRESTVKDLATARETNIEFAVNSNPPTVANYEIEECLGQGSMGAVWKAQQKSPVQRSVALKVIHPQHLSREFHERFGFERQALALMDHPGIAKLFDSGTTEAGHPFFAMEQFNGKRIDHFCNQHQLSIASRLNLFVKICSAVQHAHQKRIIHRDIKPSNILARLEEDELQVKVIDFGLAKAFGQTSLVSNDATAFGQVLGTFHYMSPEQAQSDSLHIDSRTDVYSLGALLYELLCGETPFFRDFTTSTPVQKAVEIISESAPLTPSQRIPQPGNDSDFFDSRRVNRSALHSMLIGDLDWIVMKAIDKDPERRYQSASELGADVQRFLRREPVLARPPSIPYRLGKFVSKNKILVSAATLVLISTLAGVIASSIGWSRAVAAEKLAEQRFEEAELARTAETKAKLSETKRADSELQAKEHAEQLLKQTGEYNDVLKGMFSDLNLRRNEDDAPIERQLADRLIEAGTLIAKNDYDHPKYQLQLITELGETLLAIGYPQDAVELMNRSVEIVESNVEDDRLSWIAYSSNNLGRSLLANGDHKQAAEVFQQAEKIYSKIDGPEHKNTLSARHGLATANVLQGQINSAISQLEELLPLREKAYGKDHRVTLISRSVLATAYGRKNKLNKAISLTRQVYEARRKALGEDGVGTIVTMSNLADLHFRNGNNSDALELQSRAFELFTSKLGTDHPNTLAVQTKLATVCQALGSFEKAQNLVDGVIPLLEKRLGEVHPRTLKARSLAAILLQQANKSDEALAMLLPLYERAVGELGASSPDTLDAGSTIIILMAHQQDFERATDFGEEIVRLAQFDLGATHSITGKATVELAKVAMYSGELKKAQTLLEHFLDAIDAENSDPETTGRRATIELVKVYLAQRLTREAEASLDRLIKDWDNHNSGSLELAQTFNWLQGKLYCRKGLWREAEEKLSKLVNDLNRNGNGWSLGLAYLELANTQFRQKNPEDAAVHFQQGIEILGQINTLSTDEQFETEQTYKALRRTLKGMNLDAQIDELTKIKQSLLDDR